MPQHRSIRFLAEDVDFYASMGFDRDIRRCIFRKTAGALYRIAGTSDTYPMARGEHGHGGHKMVLA